ncbi:hypothetical protein BIY27_23135 [Gibbsiella quercinecans]|nr:hypothetical protein BIY27_23135 [Gibbsiella quercinecans]
MRNVITVHNNRMLLVECQGLRVVTFSMIDEAHQRPKGTARAAFNRNRHRFTEAPSVRIDVTPIKNANGAVGKHHETHFARTKISSTG